MRNREDKLDFDQLAWTRAAPSSAASRVLRKMKFASRKQLNQQKKAEKQFSPSIPAHLSKKQMIASRASR